MSWYKKSQTMNTCFYVDMDNTLLYTRLIPKSSDFLPEDIDKDSDEMFAKNGFKLGLDDGRDRYWSKVRPGATEFLSALKGMGKVFLCTSATKDYADKALEILGLDGFFDGRYYRHDVYRSVTQNSCSRFYLIDDLAFEMAGIAQKMRFLGSGMESEEPWGGDIRRLEEYKQKRAKYEAEYGPRHIQVKPFRGEDGDADLSRALAQIKESLNSLSSYDVGR